MDQIHVIDFEGCLRTGIIEFGVVSLKGSTIDHTRTGFCCPDAPITPQETLLHGLREDELKKEAPFSLLGDYFLELRSIGLFAAHHATVEHRLLSRYWSVVPVRGIASSLCSGSWGPWIDSRLVARHLLNLEDFSLGNVVKELELQEELNIEVGKYCSPDRATPHCALYDALASALILRKLQEQHALTVTNLLRLSQSEESRSKGDLGQQELEF